MIFLGQHQAKFALIFIKFLEQCRKQFLNCNNFISTPYIAPGKSIAMFEVPFKCRRKRSNYTIGCSTNIAGFDTIYRTKFWLFGAGLNLIQKKNLK